MNANADRIAPQAPNDILTLARLGERVADAARGVPDLRMTRVFDFPRERVFDAWRSTAERVARWFTPAPLTTSRCEVDLRTSDATKGAHAGWSRTLDQLEAEVRRVP